MQLNDIAHIFSGYHFRGAVRDYMGGSLPVLQVNDLVDRREFDGAAVKRIAPDFDPAPYLLREADLLFLARGHRHWARVGHGVEGMIAPGYFYIVRPHPDVVDSEFLAWWLNHSSTQRRLELVQRGSNIPFVPLGEFKALPVRLPPLEVQKQVAAYCELASQENEIMTKLREAHASLADALVLQAVTGAIAQ